MTADKPRRLPRFSLITLLVAVNVAGVLVWANVRTRDDLDFVVVTRGMPPFNDLSLGYSVHFKTALLSNGWPLVANQHYEVFDVRYPYWNPWTLAVNIAVILILITGSSVLTEYLVRHIRKAKAR